MFIILYYTHYAYSNAGIVSDSTDDSWVGYDYNAKTWLDMSYLANDVGKQMAQMGNIYTDYHTDSEIEAKEGKSVIGTDDRIKVNNDSDKTAKGIAYITSVMYNDNMNTCSGTLIAENYVLTAAHCVTQATDSINKPCPSGADCVNGKYGDTSKFNKRINVYINRNNGITNDGYYSAHKVYVQQAWRIDGLIHSPYDIALIELMRMLMVIILLIMVPAFMVMAVSKVISWESMFQ